MKILLHACAEHYLGTRQARAEQTFTTERASAKTEIPGELLVLAVCQARKLSTQRLPMGLPGSERGSALAMGPTGHTLPIPPPECAPDRQGSGEQEPFQGFLCKRSAAGVELLFPLSLSLFLFSCLAFANPQAAVSLSKEALMGGGPGKISPTDECNLDRKYVFYQRPHVANSN